MTMISTPANECLACGSHSTEIRGRVLHCWRCETVYYVPARLLMMIRRNPTR